MLEIGRKYTSKLLLSSSLISSCWLIRNWNFPYKNTHHSAIQAFISTKCSLTLNFCVAPPPSLSKRFIFECAVSWKSEEFDPDEGEWIQTLAPKNQNLRHFNPLDLRDKIQPSASKNSWTGVFMYWNYVQILHSKRNFGNLLLSHFSKL